MTRCLILALAFASALGTAPGLAQIGGQLGGPARDCAAEARFDSQPLGDGRYLYRFTMANPSRTAGLRYSYSFALPGSAGQAEALNGYLPPGASIDQTLATGTQNLGTDALRAATTLRCFAL